MYDDDEQQPNNNQHHHAVLWSAQRTTDCAQGLAPTLGVSADTLVPKLAPTLGGAADGRMRAGHIHQRHHAVDREEVGGDLGHQQHTSRWFAATTPDSCAAHATRAVALPAVGEGPATVPHLVPAGNLIGPGFCNIRITIDVAFSCLGLLVHHHHQH